MPKTVAIMFLSWGPAVVRYARVEAMLGAFGFAGPASGLDLVGQDRQVAEPPGAKSRSRRAGPRQHPLWMSLGSLAQSC
jgi:hypothetical protein